MLPDTPEWTKFNPFTSDASTGLTAKLTKDMVAEEVMGFLLVGDITKDFFTVICPCGVIDSYPLNSFPEKDTPHSCGDPKHWFVKYKDKL